MRNVLLVAGTSLSLCVSISTQGSQTWYVDCSVTASGDGTSWQTALKKVQDGIDKATDGDTVIVAEGTYYENVRFQGKNIVLTSTNPLDPAVIASTIIDGNQAGSVVTFAGTEDDSCVLRGFTIRNGKSSLGGGILGSSGSQITGAAVRNNIIRGNSAEGGGGLFWCRGMIENNTISGNFAINRGNGGGLSRCYGIIRNNIIAGNSAEADGGGLWDCQGKIENNTIHGNTAGGEGSGLWLCSQAASCIVWGNRGSAQLVECSVPSYSCIQGWMEGGTGNIASMPYFVDPENGDFHLQSWSPCIDAGDPSSSYSNEPQPNGSRVDMGAYGNTLEATSKSPDTDADGLADAWEQEWFENLSGNGPGDPDGDGIPNATEYRYGWDPTAASETLVENLTKAARYQTIQAALLESRDGDEIVASPGIYTENIGFGGKNVVLRSTNPSDASGVASTVIDGGGLGAVVTFAGTETESCVLSGFTIRNGKGVYGGGISGGEVSKHTRVTIENNVIRGNSATDSGGGLALCDGLIQKNLIAENQADYAGGGLSLCDGVIQNNRIAKNTSGSHGGGLSFCDAAVQNSVIYGNSAGEEGGGLALCFGTITDCIIWGNQGGGQLYGGRMPSFSCIEGGAAQGSGNIGLNPHFVDPEKGDFHLRSWSPCIDAGDPSSPYSNEPQPNGGRVDMGAYGNTPEATSRSPDTDADGLPDDWELHWFGNLAQTGTGDPDGDGIVNKTEYEYGSNPTVSSQALVENVTKGLRYETIQAALLDSSDGDEIVVPPGAYKENINFFGKNVVLRSEDPSDRSVVAGTIIDGGASGSVVTFAGTELETCVLSGFTIRNGKAGSGGIFGGDHHTLARVSNNIICGNNATAQGGGLFGCDGEICDNIIRDNTAVIEGGGLCYCGGIIHNNIVWGNTVTLSFPIFGGGGLARCNGTIENNTVFGNSGAGHGGGLESCGGTIKNNIIWDNRSGDTMQIYGSSTPTYSCIEDWSAGGIGNISLDPCFVDPANGDFHLTSSSPCIDAGDPASPCSNEPQPNGSRVDMGAYGNTPEATSRSLDTDADGLPDDWELHWFGDLDESGTGDPDGDGVSNLKEYRYGWDPTAAAQNVIENLTKGLGHQSIQGALLGCDEGDELVVYPGLYKERVRLEGKNVVLRSRAPLDPNVVANTIIDGENADSVVTFSGEEDETCVLSGFTIRNGKALYDAGICGAGTHATIENNVIRNNTADAGAGGVGYCDGRVQNNVIVGNSGGGLSFCDGVIQNNLICFNTAGQYWGGGLYACWGTIQNNTIVGNSAESGGGLCACRKGIRNCIIWGNTATDGMQISDSADPLYCCVQDWTGGGTGNVTGDPLFVNPAGGDYRLQDGSPCIDKGVSYYWFAWPQRDLDGNCRLAGSGVDMGCYEFGASVDLDGDLLSDEDESKSGTDPDLDDTDGDGLRDGLEAIRRSNPLAVTPPGVVNVPADFVAIQAALCVAVAGDEIVVAPGTYHESLCFFGVDVILHSSDPEDSAVVDATILDGNGAAPVVSFAGSETEACVLSGFTIQNGAAVSGGGICGGTRDCHTRATIRNNTITKNRAEGEVSWLFGGAIAYCDGIIQNNVVFQNSDRGIMGCRGIVQDNFIIQNQCQGEGGGLADCTGVIRNNVIAGNRAQGGAGLAWCNGTIQNNVVAYNFASSDGGGFYECNGSIINCIIWGNTAPGEPQLWRSSQPVYSCIQGWTAGGEGNIAQDPRFVDPDGPDNDPSTYPDNNYRLGTDSPCMDAGRNEEWMWEGADLDGNPRILPGNSSWRVDMGAYEHAAPTYRLMNLIRHASGMVILVWTSAPDRTYTVWSSAVLPSQRWTEEVTLQSERLSTTWTDPDSTSTRKFYRIEMSE